MFELLQRLHEENEKLFDRLTEKASAAGSPKVGKFHSTRLILYNHCELYTSMIVNVFKFDTSFLTFIYYIKLWYIGILSKQLALHMAQLYSCDDWACITKNCSRIVENVFIMHIHNVSLRTFNLLAGLFAWLQP